MHDGQVEFLRSVPRSTSTSMAARVGVATCDESLLAIGRGLRHDVVLLAALSPEAEREEHLLWISGNSELIVRGPR
jgi:hypothetical protein